MQLGEERIGRGGGWDWLMVMWSQNTVALEPGKVRRKDPTLGQMREEGMKKSFPIFFPIFQPRCIVSICGVKATAAEVIFGGYFGRLSAAALQQFFFFLTILERSSITPRQRSSALIPPTTPSCSATEGFFRRLIGLKTKRRNKTEVTGVQVKCTEQKLKGGMRVFNKHRVQPPGGCWDIFSFICDYLAGRERKHMVGSFNDGLVCLYCSRIHSRPLPGDHLTFRVDSQLEAGWAEGSPPWPRAAAEAEESAPPGGLAGNCWSHTSPDGKQLC